MHRRSSLLALVAVVFSAGLVASPIQDKASAPINPAVRDDAYAIYSTLLANPKNGMPSGAIDRSPSHSTGTILIVGTTRPGTHGGSRLQKLTPQECVQPSSAYAADWSEILNEFNQYVFSPEKLEPVFGISRKYTLLSDTDLTMIQNPSPHNEPELFSLSHVFFNKKRTLALTEIGMNCGRRCGHGGWRLLEKVSGKWQSVPAGDSGCVDWES